MVGRAGAVPSEPGFEQDRRAETRLGLPLNRVPASAKRKLWGAQTRG